MSGDGESIQEAVRAASEVVQRCHDMPPAQAKQTFDEALVRMIRARNERLRKLGAGERARDGELRQVNAIVSLMYSIEFPLAGFHRKRLDQVTQALHSLHEGAAA
jgi:hypothetical protein